jgi:catechol 2,3-dioxygenase-like lactoylglutathione lyase family enzyme
MPDRPGIDQFVTFVYCRDLNRAVAFYEGIVGLEMVLDQGSCRIYRAAGDAFFALCQSDQIRAPSPGGIILTFVTADVDGWHAYLVAAGVGIEKTPQLYEKFDIYHLFARDPDGHLVEFQSFRDPGWPAPLRP